ncbi:MAG: transposase [Candidatus Aureabacteria bacterium]|nr:transposase [Candidatus Auribacterota bacterium]
MARPLRIEYPGAWYHVTSRGNGRGKIFRDDKDRKRFLEALEESIERFKVEVHCYVLMSNHFHFLLRTLEANLSRFMQRFNTAYTTYYNLRHHRAGHLYQGRFKAIVVEADEYLKELSRYLHLNPVRLKKYKELTVEGKGKILKEYKWSSLPGYVGLMERDEFVTYGTVLGYMGGDTKEGKKRYRDFVISGLGKGIKNPITEARAGAVLGTDSFIEWARRTFIDGREWTRKEQPQVGSLRGVIPVLKIATVVGKEYEVRPEELVKARSPWREARRVLIEMSYRLNMSYRPLQKLGDELGGIGGAAVAHNHNRLQKHMLYDKKFAKRIEEIYKSILSQ